MGSNAKIDGDAAADKAAPLDVLVPPPRPAVDSDLFANRAATGNKERGTSLADRKLCRQSRSIGTRITPKDQLGWTSR